MKVKELISTPLITSILHTSDYHFMDEYTNNSIALDNHYIKLFGGLQIDEELIGSTDTQTKTNITNEIRYYIIAHKEQLNRLYDINNLEYNPLYNVDAVETTTYGRTNKTDTFGVHKTDNDFGSTQTDRTTQGYNVDTVLGETNVTTTNNVSGFNEGSLVEDNNTNTSSEEVLNRTTYNPQSEQLTTESFTNTTTSNQHIDTYVEDEHTVTLDRRGNIGTTKSTDLVQSEFDVWSKIAFWDYLFTSLFATISIPLYD